MENGMIDIGFLINLVQGAAFARLIGALNDIIGLLLDNWFGGIL
jgi:hypothetical protein